MCFNALVVTTQGGGMKLAHGAVFRKLNGQIKSTLRSLRYSQCCSVLYPQTHVKYIVNIQYISPNPNRTVFPIYSLTLFLAIFS